MVENVKPTRRKPRWRTCVVRGVLLLIILFLVFVGPWPGGNDTYVGSAYQRSTLARLDALGIRPSPPGMLWIGVAEIDITPADAVGHELAGYANQPDKRARSVHRRVHARALTIKSATDDVVTILTADLLQISAALARTVLFRVGLAPGDIYFTASHTHSGPGQWAEAWYEQFAVGEFDPAYFNQLAGQLASIVRESRGQLVPVEIGVSVADAPEQLRPRIDGVDATDDRVVALVFRALRDAEFDADAPPLAVLVTYAAHPTACGRDDLRMSADYPGALVERLRELTGARHVLFAAGAVGDAAPMPPSGLNAESADHMGRALAELIAPAIDAVTFQREAGFSSVHLDVDLPCMRVPLSAHLRTSPVLPWFFDDRRTHVHVLRVGPVLLAGMPCDFSGGAAHSLITWADAHDLVAMPTSFGGDYHGYFMSSTEFFNCPKLEQRATFLRGPWAGEYVADLAIRIGAQMCEPAPK